MTNERKKNPVCTHLTWKKVQDSERPDGSYDVMCTECSTVKPLQAPKTEGNKDERPLLVE